MEGWVSPGPGCKQQLAHGCYTRSPVISATSHLGDSQLSATNQLGENQLGDTSRSTRRQLISFECLFRIDRRKQVEQESRAIAGKPCGAAVNFEIRIWGITYNRWLAMQTFWHRPQPVKMTLDESRCFLGVDTWRWGQKMPNLTCLVLHSSKLQPCFIRTPLAVNLA